MTGTDLEKLADDILSRIRRRPGKPVSIASLQKAFKVQADDIFASLGQLKKLGYKIRKKTKGQIAFVAAPDSLTGTEVRYHLPTKFIGRKIHAYQSVKSTNDIAAQLAQTNATEGAIVTAEMQTRGRGRLGRQWFSPSRAGIYVSIILKPKFRPEAAPGLAVMTALALADAINKHTPGEVKIKWPNDIHVNGRKVAGILTELSADRNKVDYVVVGVGINVNHKPEDFPPELKPIATSLRAINRRKAPRLELLRQFLTNFESEYLRYQKGQLSRSRKRIIKYSSLIGQNVKLSFGNHIVEGKAVDIDATGALIIEKDGQRRVVTSGEVTVVKE